MLEVRIGSGGISIMSAAMSSDDTATIARIDRLIEFASDTAQLADQRIDLDLRALVDDLYRDLIRLKEE